MNCHTIEKEINVIDPVLKRTSGANYFTRYIMEKKIMVSLPTEVPKINDNVNMHFMWVELNKYIDNLLPRINILDLNCKYPKLSTSFK
ncbi:hypothetical protein BGI32_06785 [Snodgrassella alvi]|uniref:Uncharacterized protein n=1 Tax=Snodgrassella alvi TaxID=1196083 RepID=A0A2N9WTH9_9NEIS|nr:hypothetical protein BGI32_06785 [Snodgrassella alvi]